MGGVRWGYMGEGRRAGEREGEGGRAGRARAVGRSPRPPCARARPNRAASSRWQLLIDGSS
eukprot:2959104-Prymnesium_polylepis.2